MTGKLRNFQHSLGFLCGSVLVLQLGCNDNSFQSARVTSDPAITSTVDSEDAIAERAGTEDASAANSEGAAAQVEVSDISTSRKPDTIINTFSATSTQESSFRFSLAPKAVTTDFTLEDILSARKDTFTQLTRNPMTDNFKQGNAGQPLKESFDQTARKGLVDILVVVDDSGSMSQEQVNLASKLNELLASIKDANWQISVITTSPKAPAGVDVKLASSEGKELCTTTLIKAGEIDAAAKFDKAVNAGIAGNGNEQGIRQSVVGLRCLEKPWLRPASTLAVLIISDEDNCSVDGKDCGTLPWAKESYLINYVENTLGKTIGKNAGFYGIVGPNRTVCPTAGNAATQYLRLFDYKANGAVNYGNICDASYKTTLNRISDNIALLLNAQFELNTLPDANSLKLSLILSDGMPKALDSSSYAQTGKVITFMEGKEPPFGSKVIADYLAGAKPILRAFTLSQDPASGTLSVKINGAMAAASSFNLAGRTVTFNETPAELASIITDYRQNTALLDRFKPNASAVPGSIKVLVNGAATQNFTFDAARNELIFAKAPADGLSVEVSYDNREGPRLVYTLPVSKDGFNFRIMDQASAISFTQSGNSFTIGTEAHKAGKALSLSYDIPDSTTKAFEIGRMPIAGSAEIVSGNVNCDLGMGFDVLNDKLISTCVSTALMEFTLKYKYLEAQRSFKLIGIDNPDQGTWAVYINGEATKDYIRTTSTITLTSDPALDARIEIHYTVPE